MNHQELHTFLLQHNPIEALQLIDRRNIPDVYIPDYTQSTDSSGEAAIPRIPKSPFFEEHDIYIKKHNRFADMIVHTHDFIELSYVYSGTVTQVINDQEYMLKQGQICLLDKDVPHTVKALEEEDILLSIIFEKESLSTVFLGRLAQSQSIVSNFLLNAASEKQDHDHFIIFHAEENLRLQHIMRMMCCEFYDPADFSQELIQNYLTIAFIELMRVYKHDKNFEEAQVYGRGNIIEILEYIEQHPTDCSLQILADHFGFTNNYLSNLIKERTGKTYTELITKQKMHLAANLLKNSDSSIEEICHHVGYANISFFYRKFKEVFGITPNQYRKIG